MNAMKPLSCCFAVYFSCCILWCSYWLRVTRISFLSLQELQRRRDEELAALQEQLADLISQLETLEMNMKKFTAGLQQMAELQTAKETANKEEEEAYKIKKQTIDLLPNADKNIAMLQVCVFVLNRGREILGTVI